MDVLSKMKPAGRSGRGGSQLDSSSPPTKEDILNTLESFAVDNKENNNNAESSLRSSLEGKVEKMSSGPWEIVDYEPSTPASLSHSYSMEWEKLFSKPDRMKHLKARALDGDLRSSRFRSVVWKLFLEVLPSNKDEWIAKTRSSRAKFEELKNRLIVNPRKAVDSVDITLNNPLSQDEESPWNKFFQDNELRLTIKQDVIRTFPEVEFFRGSDLGEMMTDILFVFSRELATHSYRQGMHELLAPLIFVLHCDHQAFLHACEIESVLTIMKEVMDPAYLEHDAYTMFCQVMETVEPWYLSRDIFCNPKTGSYRNLELLHATPFAKSQDLNPSNAIVTKLTRIQDYILKKFDPELHQHLERLEIAPQIYGIRWLRLLFGREFPMQDLLMLWDAIFGDGIGFDLVDYIFVAMLMYIRDILLTNDYATCLTVLMKYPPVADVHYFIVKATWLREPNQHPRPPNYTHQGPIKTSSSIGGSSGGLSSLVSASENTTSKKSRDNDPIGSTVSLSQVEETMYRNVPSASSMARLDAGSNLRSAQSSPGVHHGGSVFPLTPDDVSVAGSPSKPKSRAKQKKLTKLERELELEVARLEGELHDKENMCRYCSSKLDVHIGRLQQDLSRSDTDMNGEVMVSLAGLKLVRDILNGTLRFSQNIASDEDLALIEGHFLTRDGAEGESTAATSTDNYSKVTTAETSPDFDILSGTNASGSLETSKVQRDRGKLFYMSSEEGRSPDELSSAGLTRQASADGEMADLAAKGHGKTASDVSNFTNPFQISSSGQNGHGHTTGNNVEAEKDRTNGPSSNSRGPAPSKIKSIFKTSSTMNDNHQQQSPLSLSEAEAQQPSISNRNTSSVRGKSSGLRSASVFPSISGKQNMSKGGDRGECRELTSLDLKSQRSRAKSDVTGATSYWPDFLSSNIRLPWNSEIDDKNAELSDGRDGSRERSHSQPTGRPGGAAYSNDKESFDLNPLYKMKYPDTMEY